MRQKYTIIKNDKTEALTIQEYAELNKDIFSLICEESYQGEVISSAVRKNNKRALIDTLRTPNLYPVSDFIDRIADSVINLYENPQQSGESGSVELIFDDVDLFKHEPIHEEEEEDESVEIDELLEDDTEES